MNGFFVFLLLVVLGLFVWSMVAPNKLAKKLDKSSHKDISRKHFGIVFGGLAIIFFVLVGITAPKQTTPVNKTIQLTTSKSTTPAPAATYKTVTQTKSVPFASTTAQDSNLAKGTNQITTNGVNGVETLTYQDTYINGKQTAQKLVSDVVTTKPVTQVTSVGSYVAPAASSTSTDCTNGTYVNSAGNTVCSPETSSSVPAGATAQCVDGTYSFSQSHSGTCSHHGGVAQWL
jgi:resuscitation-promoting factor RpfB